VRDSQILYPGFLASLIGLQSLSHTEMAIIEDSGEVLVILISTVLPCAWRATKRPYKMVHILLLYIDYTFDLAIPLTHFLQDFLQQHCCRTSHIIAHAIKHTTSIVLAYPTIYSVKTWPRQRRVSTSSISLARSATWNTPADTIRI